MNLLRIATENNSYHVGEWICSGVTDDFGHHIPWHKIGYNAYYQRYSWFWQIDFDL